MTAATDLATRIVFEVTNPLVGVTPSMSVFGVAFEGRVQLILGGVWALVLAACAAAVLVGAGKWSWASKVTHSSEGAMESAGQFKTAAIAFAAAAAASLILGALIWVVQGA